MPKALSGKSKKSSREYRVLIGLVELYLKNGKPIGSNTLKEHGFDDLSSATIRNYFSQLEEQGYLKQQHSSGGRIPTNLAFRLYAMEYLDQGIIEPADEAKLHSLKSIETKSITTYLQNAAELLSELTGFAVFLSSPRFDHDFIFDIKLVSIDYKRIICILITDFGLIQTEVLYIDKRLSAFSLKRIESYFHWRLASQPLQDKPANLTIEEEALGLKLYNEMMVRYIVRYSNFSDEDVHRTGFARLLNFAEFNDPINLASSLALFESSTRMRLLLNDCSRENRLQFWIGSDLNRYSPATSSCSVIAIPYRINNIPAGAMGILGPCRMPYRQLFGIMHLLSDYISEWLTNSLYKFKLTFRTPHAGTPYVEQHEKAIVDQTGKNLLT